jgi:hypothetical protein
MSSNNFESLQEQHENLLKRQFEISTLPNLSDKDKEALSKEKEKFSNEVNKYIAKTKKEGATVFLIQEREQLRSNLRYWANYIYEVDKKLPNIDLPETISSKKGFLADSNSRSAILAVFVVIVLLLVFFVGRNLTAQWTPTVRYGFDEDTMGWVPQTRSEDQAVIDVQRQVKFGLGSLELEIELRGHDNERSKGEAFVSLSSNPPAGALAPLDLNGKPITISVYVPSAAIGNLDSPNGIQVFVRDIDGKSEYSVWTNLSPENTDRWIDVSLLPSTTIVTKDATGRPTGASMDAGFDPSKLNIVGLKIGAGDGFESVFRGSIWIDKVSWP